MNETTCREIVRIRSGGVCEVCGKHRAESMHHRKNRSQGGKWTPGNILHTCGDGTRGCHGWITEHPALAHSSGHAVKSFEDPLDVPAVLHHGLVLLDDNGYCTPALETT